MRSWLELVVGVLIWCGVLWDGFATIILPRTLTPMRRLSGRFYRWSWRLWAAAGRRIRDPHSRLTFVAIYGPISIVLLLVLWAGLMIVAFALIYQGLGPRFQAEAGSVGFGTLLYMSGSTFLTLGLGDVTSRDPFARLFMILETGTGYIFLGLMITYMPLLNQAYGSREVGNLLIHSRAGHPPSAIKLLHRYSGTDRSEILRGNLREAERWMADDPPEPSLPSCAVILPGAALGPILVGLPDDGPRCLRPADRGRRWTTRGAGEGHLPHGYPLAQGPDGSSRSNGRSPVSCEAEHSRFARPVRGREGIESPFEPGAGCGDSTPPACSSLRRVSRSSLRMPRDPLALMDTASGSAAGERCLGGAESSARSTYLPHHASRRTGPSGRRTGRQPPGRSRAMILDQINYEQLRDVLGAVAALVRPGGLAHDGLRCSASSRTAPPMRNQSNPDDQPTSGITNPWFSRRP